MFAATNGSSTFGGLGSTPQASPFGSTTLQSQPAAFGSGLFGSTTPFGGSTQPPVYGASITPVFYPATTPAFCATSTPFLGTTFCWTGSPAFGSAAPGFGVSMGAQPLVFGSWAAFNPSVFGQATALPFGSSSTPAFYNSTTSPFGNASSSTAFGPPNPTPFGSTAPGFGVSTGAQPLMFGFLASFNPSVFRQATALPFAFHNSTTSPFGNASSSTAFGAPNPTPFGSIGTPSLGCQSSSFGVQTTPPAFGGQSGGSRVAPYAPTTEAEAEARKLESISAMPIYNYKDKSHEELRWEDYQLGDKGGASSAGTGFGATVTPPIGQSSNRFSTSTPPSPFDAKPQTGSSLFPTQSSNPFQPPSSFGVPSASLFARPSSLSPFGTPTQSASSSPLFPSTTSTGTVSSLGSTSLNPQGGAFQSTTPSLGAFRNSTQSPAFGAPDPTLATPSNSFSSSTDFGQSTSLASNNNRKFTVPWSTIQPFSLS